MNTGDQFLPGCGIQFQMAPAKQLGAAPQLVYQQPPPLQEAEEEAAAKKKYKVKVKVNKKK